MEDGSPLTSVDKALRTLDLLAEAGPDGAPLGELAAQLGMNKATVHRTLAALRFRGYVTQDSDDSRYRLGSQLPVLVDRYFRSENLPDLMHPTLVEVCARTSELVHLGLLDSTTIVYLDKVEPDRALRVWSAVGRRAAASTTALGRAILGSTPIDAESLRRYVTGTQPDGRKREYASLLAAVHEARANGYAAEREENEPGIACIAIPLLRRGRPIAAISITAPVERMSPARSAELIKIVSEVISDKAPVGITIPAQLSSL
jgi:DNA-binding IclR family transcriptional regulator